MTALLSDPAGLFQALGSTFVGLAEVLGAFGAGIGFLLRSRQSARRERARTETAAALAANEARKTLEERLEAQHKATLDSKDVQIAALTARQGEQIDELVRAYETQIASLKDQVSNLTQDRTALLDRLLKKNADE